MTEAESCTPWVNGEGFCEVRFRDVCQDCIVDILYHYLNWFSVFPIICGELISIG